MMSLNAGHRFRYFMLIVLASLLLVGFVLWPRLVAANSDPVVAAWEKARAAGSYHFDSNVTQITIPSPTVANIGRSSQTQALHLTGQTDLRQQRLQMQLWSDGGSVAQNESSLSLKLEGGQTFMRQPEANGWGEWQPLESGIDGFAPQGDFLAYLAAVRDVQAHAPETRTLPDRTITFTRYSFTIDGPTFANFMREQMEAALRAKGELPPGVQLQAADYYRQMTGDGELWVREDGLPLRQMLNLTFPEQQDEFVTAQINVDFYRFGEGVQSPQSAVQSPGNWLSNFGLWTHDSGLWTLDFGFVVLLSSLLALGMLIVYYRRARIMQTAVATAVITSLIITPLLSTFQADAFFATQTAKAATQDEQQAESELQHSLSSLGDRPEFNPHLSPESVVRSPESVVLSHGSSATDSGLQSPVSSLQAAPAAQTVDDGTDSDNDGLSDFVEARVGTDPNVADSDEDGLPDALEINGFSYAGKQWYSDPGEIDSNGDGLADEAEWGRNPDGSLRTIPLDTDGDGIPDLFDADNDNDSVPDRQDLSPFSRVTNTFSENTPFNLTINNLTANQPTFVDFQLRPTSEKHLWFAFNVLDWPRDDQGQVVDIDSRTYADLAAAEGRTAIANESGGDMKLIPMLEIRLPTNGANLPAQDDLTPYGITVNDLTQDGSQQVAYVPLTLVTDEESGQRVAFSGRMRYLPGVDWPSAHGVRLAWVVQALVDLPCDPQTDNSADCQDDGYYNNVPQVIQSYYDDWTLTGFNVSEQQGAKTAVIYEDPQFDDNHHDDAGLVALTHAFDETFLAARDANNDNQRDVTLEGIAQNLTALATTWEIPQRFNIENASYATFDQAVMTTAMNETTALLNRVFDPYWSSDPTLKPTLLYAYEQTSRGLSLDATVVGGNYITANLNNFTVDFQPANQPMVEKVTVAGLKWAHYCRESASAAWATCVAEDYWEGLEQLYGNGILPGDPVDPAVQAGRMMILQLYNLSLVQGINNVVQQDNQLISPRYTVKTDPQVATTIRSATALGSAATVFLVNQSVLASLNNTGLVKQLGLLYKPTFGQAREAWKYVSGQTKAGSDLRGSAIGFSIKAVYILGLLTAAALAASLHGQDAKIALRAFVIGLQLNFAVIDPILIAVKWSSALATGGSTASVLKSGSEVLGMTKQALAVGTVIAIAVVWGFFIYSMAANSVTPFSPEFNRALAETIAATIYLVLLALISLTVIGLILVGIVAVIDAILTAICELGVDDLRSAPGLGGACFTLGTVAIKAIAYLLYNYDVMINTDRRDMVAPGAPQTELVDPSRGFVTGNELSITMPITTNISHKSPDAANGLMINAYLYFFSASNLRSTTFKYSLTQPDAEELSTGLNTMSGSWQNVREHHKYAATTMYGGHANTTPAPVTGINLPAGINQTPEFQLNMGYALPAYECWIVPVLGVISAPVCYTRTFSGHSSTKIDTLRYDIFPASFAEFMTIVTKPDGGYGLGWDSGFPSMVDADGDGLRSNAHGGLDPSDDPNAFAWDTDRDGLSDGNEMERRAAGFAYSPIQCDTDGDGLTDAQEAQFGTNPANRDSDNDGLRDGEEVWHQVYDTTSCQPTPAWSGGWEIEINASTPFTIRVTANPSLADSDGDGIDDLAERQLAQHIDPSKRVDDENRPYHPGVFNSSPIKVYPATDKQYVRPGGSVIYTNTVVATVEVMPSVLDVDTAGVFGSAPAPALLGFDPLSFSGSQTVTHQMVLTAQPNLPTQSALIGSSVRARLTDTGPATLGWEPLVPQTLGSAAQPARFGAAAAPLADRTDTFITSALLSSSTTPGGQGFIQTNAIPGGESGQLANDGNTSGAGTTVRGASAADIACNNLGACMVVWEEREVCNTHTINYLQVDTANDQSGGIEPVIYWIADYDDTNPADGGYQLLWNPYEHNSLNLDSGAQVGPNANGFPITVNVCGDGRIDIYEADSETITDDPSNMDLIGSSLRVNPDNFNLDPNLTIRYTSSGVTSVVDLNETIPRKNLDVVRGALVDSTGAVIRAAFDIPSAFPVSTGVKSHNFRPVVASDGVNFLVVSELADETNTRTYLQAQSFTAAGLPDGTPVTHLIESLRVALSTENSVAADVAWIGDRYRVARKFIRPSGAQAIHTSDNVMSVTATWNEVATAALYDERGIPVLAYNPLANQTLLLYTHETFELRRILNMGANPLPILSDAVLSPTLTSQDPPHAVYNPMANAWLLSWTTPSGQGTGVVYSLWQPDLSGRILADQKVPMAASNFNSRAQSCPVLSALPFADLRFEALPGFGGSSPAFFDSAGRGVGTCSGTTCPAAAAPGAVDSQGNAVGTPASDYAVRFDGVDDAIALLNYPIGETFSIAFWYKAGVTNQANAPFTVAGLQPNGSAAVALRIFNHTGRIEFVFNTTTIAADANLNDGRWHFITATRNGFASTGTIALYLDGNPTPIAASNSAVSLAAPTTFSISGGGTTVDLDEFKLYTAALSGNTIRDLYTRSLQSYCVGTKYNLGVYDWTKLNVSTPDVRGGKLTASAGMTITIDGDLPTSTVLGLTNNQYILGNTIHTIGGNANDDTAGVAGVEVQVNGGGWQPATGAAAWAYNLAVTEGRYTIQSRATDVAGNVETPSSDISVIADDTAPNVTLNALRATPTVPNHTGAGLWSYTLGGTVNDPTSGGQPGSGVAPGSVEVLLEAQPDAGVAQGNGWQPATLNGNNWSIDYLFAEGLPDPTGVYTVSVRAADRVGNQTADKAASGILRLDSEAPSATLTMMGAGGGASSHAMTASSTGQLASDTSPVRSLITDTVTIGGVITDTGSAGVQGVEIAYIPVVKIAALPTDVSNDEAQALLDAAGRVWLPTTIEQAGAETTTWSAQVPTGLEGEYQVDLRASDTLGNRRVSANLWRGIIDTTDPRLVMTAVATGITYRDTDTGELRYGMRFVCAAQDRNLNEASFACPGQGLAEPVRSFDDTSALANIFPDLALRTGLAISYTVWSATPTLEATTSACDSFGRCANLTNTATAPVTVVSAAVSSTPQAVVVSPGEGSYIAASGTELPVTVAAEAANFLQTLRLRLDGAEVGSASFAQADAVEIAQATFSIPRPSVGTHTLVAEATDWAGVTQTTLFPVEFTFDGQVPQVTIETVAVSVADTWALGSGILRFSGSASDDVALAAVQVKVGSGLWADAAFASGAWHIAYPVPDPEGQTLTVLVRAIDLAGQISEVSREVPVNFTTSEPPDTTLLTTPTNPSDGISATFSFTGTASAVVFACRLNEGRYQPCASPWTLNELSQGPQTFSVRAIDGQGYVDPTPATFAWSVASGPLAVTITGAPGSPTVERTATFVFAGSGITGYECRLSQSTAGAEPPDFTGCSSGITYTALADGEYTFEVRGRNGEQVGQIARHVWQVVNAAPVAQDQQLTTKQAKSISLILTAQDVDPLTFRVVEPPAHGALLGSAPNLTYVPDTDFFGADSFTFQADDGQALSNIATVTLIVEQADPEEPGALNLKFYLPMIGK